MILFLLLLALVPIVAYAWAKRHAPMHRNTMLGVGLGLVASPLSLGLYATYFLGPIGIVTGMVGLVLGLWHGAPGYNICVALGLVPVSTVVEGSSHVAVEIANGVFWGIVYGVLGYGIDRFLNSRKAL